MAGRAGRCAAWAFVSNAVSQLTANPTLGAACCSLRTEWRSSQVNRFTTDILIIGGGAAGMSAALAAAESGADVTVVDDNPRLGGQIWRAELGKTRSADAARLIAQMENGSIEMVNGAQVFAAPSERSVTAETPRGRIEFDYQKLVLATGARELFLPFPGWTLPSV